MAVGYLDSQYLTNIADAIRTKAGTTATMSVPEMPTAISNIPTGGGDTPRVFKDVNFFDYDGTILYQYTLAEAQTLTELPALPTPPAGYTADSWTETLSFIQNLTGPCDVGVNYTANNAYTLVKLSIPENNFQVCTKGGSYDSSGYTKIEWGDGTAAETLNSTKRIIHTYATAGDYYVKVSPTSTNPSATYHLPDPYSSTGYSDARYGTMFMPFPYVSNVSNMYGTECNIIKEIWLGSGVNMNGHIVYLANCKSLDVLMYPKNLSTDYYVYAYFAGTSFKHLTIPSNIRELSTLDTNRTTPASGGPETLVSPSTVTVSNQQPIGPNTRRFISYKWTKASFAINDRTNLEELLISPSVMTSTFSNNPKLKKAYVQSTLSGTGIFSNCPKLESTDLSYSTVTALPSNIFEKTISLKEVIFPSTLTSFQDRCFQYSGIESITIPSGVTALGSYCFENSAIKQITLPNSCWNFDDYCFQKCYGLTEIHLTTNPNPPELGNYCFAYCYNLTSVYIYATALPASWGTYIFSNVSNVTIYIPNSALSAWQTAFPDYASLMVGWDPTN